jgi:hypothetical protein
MFTPGMMSAVVFSSLKTPPLSTLLGVFGGDALLDFMAAAAAATAAAGAEVLSTKESQKLKAQINKHKNKTRTIKLPQDREEVVGTHDNYYFHAPVAHSRNNPIGVGEQIYIFRFTVLHHFLVFEADVAVGFDQCPFGRSSTEVFGSWKHSRGFNARK